jgi:hypothetical protein
MATPTKTPPATEMLKDIEYTDPLAEQSAEEVIEEADEALDILEPKVDGRQATRARWQGD